MLSPRRRAHFHYIQELGKRPEMKGHGAPKWPKKCIEMEFQLDAIFKLPGPPRTARKDTQNGAGNEPKMTVENEQISEAKITPK